MARSIARQAAMQLLYERLSGGAADDDSLDLVYEQLSMAQPEGSARLRPSKDERQYISDVLTGVEEHQTELDDSIEKHSTGAWALSRVPHVDLSILRLADRIVQEELRESGWYRKVWQGFAVLLPLKTVGVMGDGRTYEHVIALRVVDSVDAMTADWARLPADLIARMSGRIINEVKGVNRVVYDVSSKPPSTIEWE